MSAYKSIFFILLIAGLLCNDVTAVPIYASQWGGGIGGDQTVTLYGDAHIPDHPATQNLIDAFMGTLASIERDTLLLIEEGGGLAIYNTCGNPEGLGVDEIERNINAHFLTNISSRFLYSSDLKNPHILAKNIDERIEGDFIIWWNNLFDNDQSEQARNFKVKLNDYIPVHSLDEVLEWPIDVIDDLIENSHNPAIERILGDMIQTMRSRQGLFLEFLDHIGLSDFLDTQDFYEKIVARTPGFLGYTFLSIPFDSWSAAMYPSMHHNCEIILHGILSMHYSTELLDMVALWHIAGRFDAHKNIVILVGVDHVKEIEPNLEVLGYRKQKMCDPNDLEHNPMFFRSPAIERYKLQHPRSYLSSSSLQIPDEMFRLGGYFAIVIDLYANFYLSTLNLGSDFDRLTTTQAITPDVFEWLM